MFAKPSVNFEFENLTAKRVQWPNVRPFWKNYSWTRVSIRMIYARCWWIWSFWVYKRWEIDNITREYLDQILRSCDFQTVNSEAFLLYHLAKNPRTQRKVYDEIISVLSNDNSSFTEKSLKNMPYLKACIQETLRYYSFGYNEFNLRKNCIINIKRIVRFEDCTPRFRTSQDSYQKLYPFMDTQYLKG